MSYIYYGPDHTQLFSKEIKQEPEPVMVPEVVEPVQEEVKKVKTTKRIKNKEAKAE
jgi:hypothetical protein